MPTEAPVRAEDVVPVRGRISWSAVLAGAALALAGYLLLTLLGAAVGLTVHDRVGDRGLAAGAVVWAVVVTAASLFVGGFLASQLTTGENRAEGVVYGLAVWAVTFALLVGLLASGVRAGFTAVVGAATAADAAGGTWEEGARRAGVPQADIDRARANARGGAAGDPGPGPDDRQAVEDHSARAAWYAFLGTLMSMAAAAAGGFLGAGPAVRLLTVRPEVGTPPGPAPVRTEAPKGAKPRRRDRQANTGGA